MLHRVSLGFALSLSIVLMAPPLLAVDGVLEISQAAIDGAGGFPFAITTSGSYRLTSNLTVTTDVSAITVGGEARYVTIDLNGFTIRGSASGSADGISAFAFGLTVRNGTVESFGGDGISEGATLQAENLSVTSNGGHGIDAGGSCTIRNVTARANGGDGIRIASGLVTGSVSSGNEGFGLTVASGLGSLNGGYGDSTFIFNSDGTVSGGVNLGGNLCGTTTTCP